MEDFYLLRSRKLFLTLKLVGLITLFFISHSCSRKNVGLFQQHISNQEYADALIGYHQTSHLIDSPKLAVLTSDYLLATSSSSQMTIPINSKNRAKLLKLKSLIEPKANKKVNQDIKKEYSVKNRNTFAIMGFIFTLTSLIGMVAMIMAEVAAALLVVSLPLALIFSILGLKSEKKTLASISLGIVIGLCVLIISSFVILIIALN
jgi:hypothetical protein